MGDFLPVMSYIPPVRSITMESDDQKRALATPAIWSVRLNHADARLESRNQPRAAVEVDTLAAAKLAKEPAFWAVGSASVNESRSFPGRTNGFKKE
jgi:hypothetical protein